MKTHKKPSSDLAADKDKILRKIQPTHHMKNPTAAVIPASLPYDAIVSVLSRLPLKSLLRFRHASNELASIIRDPWFVNQYNMSKPEKICFQTLGGLLWVSTNQFSLGRDAFELVEFPLTLRGLVCVCPVGSLDGLICLVGGSLRNVFLWMPSTGYCTELPEPIPLRDDRSDGYRLYHGFGYDPLHEDYKIVRIAVYGSTKGNPDSTVQVFSWRKNSWKAIEDVHYPCHQLTNSRNNLAPVFCSGALHWGLQALNKIVAFNLSEERFFEPVPVPSGKAFLDVAGAVGGCLCVFCTDGAVLEVCVMKEYRAEASWRTLSRVTIPVGRPFKPLFVTKSGKFMVTQGKELVKFDPDEKTIEKLSIPYSSAHDKQIIHDDALNC
ncbi:hypothetical protein Tsubulata_049144 [Turnera subulata]|uniref:F-box domain-containing protein n=1 Tax=Turnera subulata TaxID=218843 RepID=A0A9Q0G5Z1_9ROSI|nr:hypothetical protein Tsubulata_049144 [Turnera subulata]